MPKEKPVWNPGSKNAPVSAHRPGSSQDNPHIALETVPEGGRGAEEGNAEVSGRVAKTGKARRPLHFILGSSSSSTGSSRTPLFSVGLGSRKSSRTSKRSYSHRRRSKRYASYGGDETPLPQTRFAKLCLVIILCCCIVIGIVVGVVVKKTEG